MNRPTGLNIDVDPGLLAGCYRDTREVLAAIPDERWHAASPCREWTVREVADHLVDALAYFAAAVSGEPADRPADLLDAYDDATRRCLAAFADPGALAAGHPFGDGRQTGRAIATISLSETVVHGWDLATAAGLPYTPDPGAVALLQRFAGGPKVPGLFADPVPVPPGAPPFTALLGKLGRVA